MLVVVVCSSMLDGPEFPLIYAPHNRPTNMNITTRLAQNICIYIPVFSKGTDEIFRLHKSNEILIIKGTNRCFSPFFQCLRDPLEKQWL